MSWRCSSRLNFKDLRARCARRSKTYHNVSLWCGCSPTAEPAFQFSNKQIAGCYVHTSHQEINIGCQNTRCVQVDARTHHRTLELKERNGDWRIFVSGTAARFRGSVRRVCHKRHVSVILWFARKHGLLQGRGARKCLPSSFQLSGGLSSLLRPIPAPFEGHFG